jgi:hypothetical protein
LNVLEASVELWQAETLGLSELSSWQETQEALISIGFLDAPLTDLEKTFSNDFVLVAQP